MVEEYNGCLQCISITRTNEDGSNSSSTSSNGSSQRPIERKANPEGTWWDDIRLVVYPA